MRSVRPLLTGVRRFAPSVARALRRSKSLPKGPVMSYIYLYLVSALAFLVIDAIWLATVMRPIFERHIGPLLRENILWAPAAGFYLVYIVGIIYFATLPGLKSGGIPLALFNGAALGFLAYGTYEATNMSTIKGWSWTMVTVDTLWGMALTAAVAAIGVWAAPRLGILP